MPKTKFSYSLISFFTIAQLCLAGKINHKSFPPDFLFGTATSSYQIEGAWNLSGKGVNIWDRYTHENPELIADGSNGDIASDSYHKYEEDIALMKEMGAQFYRFSLSWSRILPTGHPNKINPDGIGYYNDLINALLKNNIIPMVTLFHWDLPQPLQDLGGFANELLVDWFEQFAKVAFSNFGDRVSLWLTFNEPIVICWYGYGMGMVAPGINSTNIGGDYRCVHNLLKAHAKAYHLYKQEYKKKQKGKIGIAISTFWHEPASKSKADIKAAERQLDFALGWHAHPIFHPKGDYPPVMKKRVALRSKAEGFTQSRLPEFTPEEVKYIRGTCDYLGFNHYTTQITANKKEEPFSDPSYERDIKANSYYLPEWPSAASYWIKVVPWGFRKVLRYIKKRYGNVEIFITENGFSDHGELNDQKRIEYHEQYLSALLDAIHEDGVNVTGYAAWSLIDNFEWFDGYVSRFGLVHVNFSDPERPRTKKSSYEYFKKVFSNRKLPERSMKLLTSNSFYYYVEDFTKILKLTFKNVINLLFS